MSEPLAHLGAEEIRRALDRRGRDHAVPAAWVRPADLDDLLLELAAQWIDRESIGGLNLLAVRQIALGPALAHPDRGRARWRCGVGVELAAGRVTWVDFRAHGPALRSASMTGHPTLTRAVAAANRRQTDKLDGGYWREDGQSFIDRLDERVIEAAIRADASR